MNDPFADLIPGNQPSQPTAQPLRQIIAPQPKQPAPKLPEDRALTNAQLNNARLEAELKRLQIQDQRRKQAARGQDMDEARRELLNVIDSAASAHRLSRSGWATGLPGQILSNIGGTQARDLAGKLDTIGGNTAFERLQKMRQESPTGGALGAITERELDLLKSTITSLDQARSEGEFQASMKKIIDTYGRTLGKLPGGHKAYDDWRKGFLGFDPRQQRQPARGWSIEAID